MRYQNLDPRQRQPSSWDVFRWLVLDRITGRRRPAPPGPPAPRQPPDLELIHSADPRPRLTWIGHASFLLQMGGTNILLDPVFSGRIGVFYTRYGEPGLTPAQLPPIDVLLVSHNHYDHLDLRSLTAIKRKATVVVPRGLGRVFVKRLFVRVVELDWWEQVELGPLTVALVPARHWSKRTALDTNRSLWGGFVLRAGETGVYFAGDSAWFDGFTEIGRRFPQLSAAILPIGGYQPAWFMERNHMTPEQAGRAFLDCGARALVPMHWGAFQMTDEPLCEPVERLRTWWEREKPAFRELLTPAVGQTFLLPSGRELP